MQRVFLRNIAGCKVGQIVPETDQYHDWDAFVQAARRFHGVTASLDSYTLPVDEATRRYALQQAPSELTSGRRGVKAATA